MYIPRTAVTTDVKLNGTPVKACFDTGAGPTFLNLEVVDKLKLVKVKWSGSPIIFFEQVKCPKRACNVITEISGRVVMVHAAVISNPNYEKKCLLRNDLLGSQKIIVDFRLIESTSLIKDHARAVLKNLLSIVQ